MMVRINGELYPKGVGQKKKEAKQNAAKNALAILEKDELGNTVSTWFYYVFIKRLLRHNTKNWHT